MASRTKPNRNGKDVRYRLRRMGYDVFLKERVLVLPPHGFRRSPRMEARMVREQHFMLQFRMFDNYNQ